MSGKNSNLNNLQFGYDMVVSVTQESVNATMKEFLSKYDGTEFVQSYVYNPDAPKGQDPNMKKDFNELKKDLGFDPFTIPNGADLQDPKVKKLLEEKFTFAFKAEIGLPDFPLDLIPDTVVFNKEGSYVTYNMVCKVFQVINLEASLYGDATFINLSQAEATEPWRFQFTVDLDIQSDNVNNHFHKLPEAAQKKIKELGEDMFSIQQLLLDLNSAGLAEQPKIEGLDPSSTAYVKLTSVFVNEYFTHLSQEGGVLLGFTVKASKNFPDETSIIPTDLNFEISAFKTAGIATTDYDLYTLNYLVMSKGNHMPAPVPFTWNWIDKAEEKDYHGTMTIKKGTFIAFLNDLLSPTLSELCIKPNVSFHVNCAEVKVKYGYECDHGHHSYNVVNDGTSHALTFSYNKSDKDDDNQYCVTWDNWGNFSVKYTGTSNVYLENAAIRIVSTAKAHVHLNIDAGVTSGDFAKYKTEVIYNISIDEEGRMIVKEDPPKFTDNSEKPDPSGWSKFITLGQINSLIDSIQDSLKDWMKDILTGNSDDIQKMLNGSSTWVYPGGKTFLFKDLYFSDHQDLVAHVVYTDPE